MVVVKWCKCLNVKICLVNPPTPVGDLKWVTEHTSMRKCGESKVQGNVVTMELEKLVQARMVQGWQVWKCFNCCIDVCAIDLNNSVALVNMDMEDNDDITQLQLDGSHVYSDCFRVIVDTSPASEDSPPIAERDPHSIENFNLLQEFVDEYLADAERVMEKRIRQYIKEQNEIFNQLRSKVNGERTVIWRRMCSVVSNPAPPPASAVLSSTPSAAAVPPSSVPASRSRASSVSRPHSRSVSGAVAPFAGAGSATTGSGAGAGSGSGTAAAHSSTFGSGSNTPTVRSPAGEEAAAHVAPAESGTPQPITPPRANAKPENVTKWQAAPRPTSTEIKSKKMQRSSSPNIFNFDDEEAEDTFALDDDDSDDEPEVTEEASPVISSQPKIPDSINLLGSSLPVSIPARNTSSYTPSARLPPQQPKKPVASTLNLSAGTPSSPNPNANAPVAARAPTTVSMSAVSMANVSNVSSTAPTHQYHALRPQTQAVAPMSSSATEANPPQLMIPKQSWHENYLGEATEESLPVEMASSFIVPLSLNRRLKSLI